MRVRVLSGSGLFANNNAVARNVNSRQNIRKQQVFITGVIAMTADTHQALTDALGLARIGRRS